MPSTIAIKTSAQIISGRPRSKAALGNTTASTIFTYPTASKTATIGTAITVIGTASGEIVPK